MNYARISQNVTTHFISDPYTNVLHVRRALRILSQLSENKAKVLIVGHKNQTGIDWKSNYVGLDVSRGRIDEKIISSAPKFYDFIICLDVPLYAPYLKGFSLPIMGVVSNREIHEHPEILTMLDYILPAVDGRTDAALRQAMVKEEMNKPNLGL